MGLIGRVFQVIGLVILLLVGLGAFLYFTDYAVEASLTERGTDESGKYVIATTKIGGYDVKQTVSDSTYTLVDLRCFQAQTERCFVTYTVQTHVLRVYEFEGGELLYESS